MDTLNQHYVYDVLLQSHFKHLHVYNKLKIAFGEKSMRFYAALSDI